MKQSSESLCISLIVAAQLLGISTGLCYRLVHEGQIPSIRLGRRLLIPLTALNEMLDRSWKEREVCRDESERPPTATVASTAVRTDDGQPPSG